MSIISGDGLTLETEMVVDSWDDLINHYSDGTKYIALDPNNKDKVIDINKFTPGTHGIAYTGRVFITSDCTWENFNGNNWTIKNLWYQGGTMIIGRSGTPLTINNLNMLNWFHYYTSNANFINLSYIYKLGSTNNHAPYILNNCKISILCTTSDTYYFFNRNVSATSSYSVTNFDKLLILNNCSINIRSTANIFNLTIENGSYDKSHQAVTSTSNWKGKFEYNNTNFKINVYKTDYIFDVCQNDHTYNYYGNFFNFCKFTIKLNDGALFYSSSTTISSKNLPFLHCFFQIKNKYKYKYQINDKAKGIINKDYSENYDILNLGTNCALLTKEQILDANYLISIGFPVMNPDGEPEESEV